MLANLRGLFIRNQLACSIPTGLGSLSLLVQLQLDNNVLTGFLLSSLTSLLDLELLSLSRNGLIGKIDRNVTV